jgi:hypothetical protein
MARCQNCGSNDADVDWGLCYECWGYEDNKNQGALSSIAAMGYASMGMHEAAASCRTHADRKKDIGRIIQHLEQFPEKISDILIALKL